MSISHNHKAIGVSDEIYEKLSDLARESGLSIAHVGNMLISYALERATVEVRISFAEPGENHIVAEAPVPTVKVTNMEPPSLPPPQKSVYKPRNTVIRHGTVREVIDLIRREGKALSASEISKLLDRPPPTLMYNSPRFQRNGNNPVRFTVRDDVKET